MQKYSLYHCILLLGLLESVMSSFNWEPYGTYFHSVKLCKGYKSINLTENSIAMHYDPVAHTSYLNGYSTNKRDGGVVMARIRFWIWSEKSKRFEYLVTFNSENVCNYPVIKKNCFDQCYLMDDDCKIKKGTKIMKQLDLDFIGHSFMGEKYFHGKFKVLLDFFTANENVTCYKVVVALMDNKKLKEYRKQFAEKEGGAAKDPAESE